MLLAPDNSSLVNERMASGFADHPHRLVLPAICGVNIGR